MVQKLRVAPPKFFGLLLSLVLLPAATVGLGPRDAREQLPESRAGTLLYLAFVEGQTASDLLAYDTTTGVATKLATLSHPPGFGPTVTLSPGRTRLAIVTPVAPVTQTMPTLATMPSSGGTMAKIDTGVAAGPESSPAWADETTLNYLKKPAPTTSVIFGSSALTASPHVVAQISSNVSYLGQTSTGLIAVASDGRGGASFILVNSDGTTRSLASVPSGFAVPIQYVGRVAVFDEVIGTGGEQSVRLFSTASPGAFQTIASGVLDSWSLSSDGSVLAISDVGADRAGRAQIRLIALASGTTTVVPTTAGRVAKPVAGRSWSADGQWLALESDDVARHRGIEIVRSDGTGLHVLLPPVNGSLEVIGWR